MDEQTPPRQRKEKSLLLEVLQFLLIAAFIVLPIRLFIAQPFVVNGESMVPNFDTGQYLIVDQLSYHFEHPQRGDVIVFKYPYDTSKFFIKRVIGLPGETVCESDAFGLAPGGRLAFGASCVVDRPIIGTPFTLFSLHLFLAPVVLKRLCECGHRGYQPDTQPSAAQARVLIFPGVAVE